MVLKSLFVGLFLLSTPALSSDYCCKAKKKLKKYTLKLVDAAENKDNCFAEAEAVGDRDATCYWHVKIEGHYYDKVEKWSAIYNHKCLDEKGI